MIKRISANLELVPLIPVPQSSSVLIRSKTFIARNIIKLSKLSIGAAFIHRTILMILREVLI